MTVCGFPPSEERPGPEGAEQEVDQQQQQQQHQQPQIRPGSAGSAASGNTHHQQQQGAAAAGNGKGHRRHTTGSGASAANAESGLLQRRAGSRSSNIAPQGTVGPQNEGGHRRYWQAVVTFHVIHCTGIKNRDLSFQFNFKMLFFVQTSRKPWQHEWSGEGDGGLPRNSFRWRRHHWTGNDVGCELHVRLTQVDL